MCILTDLLPIGNQVPRLQNGFCSCWWGGIPHHLLCGCDIWGTHSYFNQHLLGVPLKKRMSLPSAEAAPHSPFLGSLVAILTEIWGFTHIRVVFPVDKIIIVNKLKCSRMIKIEEVCVCVCVCIVG